MSRLPSHRGPIELWAWALEFCGSAFMGASACGGGALRSGVCPVSKQLSGTPRGARREDDQELTGKQISRPNIFKGNHRPSGAKASGQLKRLG